jgi:hypothetical protein
MRKVNPASIMNAGKSGETLNNLMNRIAETKEERDILMAFAYAAIDMSEKDKAIKRETHLRDAVNIAVQRTLGGAQARIQEEIINIINNY